MYIFSQDFTIQILKVTILSYDLALKNLTITLIFLYREDTFISWFNFRTYIEGEWIFQCLNPVISAIFNLCNFLYVFLYNYCINYIQIIIYKVSNYFLTSSSDTISFEPLWCIINNLINRRMWNNKLHNQICNVTQRFPVQLCPSSTRYVFLQRHFILRIHFSPKLARIQKHLLP